MIITDYVDVRINKNNVDYYKEKGYNTNQKSICVEIHDLKQNSDMYIMFKCDYCGAEFKRKWAQYNKSYHEEIPKDACEKCSGKKVSEFKKIKYGTADPSVVSSISSNQLFKNVSYDQIKEIYQKYNCELLISEDYYIDNGSHKKMVAKYRCQCGNIQDGRTINYFEHRNQLCEKCTKEKLRRDTAFRYGNDYESVKNRMLSESKELITYKEYFTKTDIVEYKCLLCNTFNKIQYDTYNNKSNNHVCSGCRELYVRKNQFNKILEVANESNVEVLTNFEQFCSDQNRLDIKCSCGNCFNVITNEFLYNNKRQCNVCGIKSRSGEFSPRWKGGITSEIDKIRHSKEYQEWRFKVFERDNFTCICCGNNKGHNLRAHHVSNFSDNIEQRFDVSNGATLCDECHDPNIYKSFHNIYGTKNNNIDQLQEYISNKRKENGLPLIDVRKTILAKHDNKM